MSSVSDVGTLMENNGLLPRFKSAFGGTEKMSLSKKFPINVRAIHFAMLELLWEHINPVFLMLLYIRAECEGDFCSSLTH